MQAIRLNLDPSEHTQGHFFQKMTPRSATCAAHFLQEMPGSPFFKK
jgi:hypothetical protein